MAHKYPSKYTSASELRGIALGKIAKSIPNYRAIPIPIVRLLVDQHLLIQTVKRTNFRGKVELVDLHDEHTEYDAVEESAIIAYSDYSFVITPAYKAFEGFLIFLSDVFNLPTEKYKHNIGGLYDWGANKAEKQTIIKALEEKLGNDKEGKDRWRELNMVLRTYRHNPAHFSGDKINTFEQAEDYIRTIINTINQMVKYLVKKEILYNGDGDIEAICDVNPEQIH